MPGLEYQKLDLHVHTPASKCYLNKDDTAKEIVEAALEKELTAIAVTDHNSAEWVDEVKKAAKSKELVIFPGVEISMSEGYHLVAIFDPSVKQKQVESFLGSIDIKPEEYGSHEAMCTKSVYEVITKIHDWEGLAILAHIDGPKGAFHEQTKTKDSGKINVPLNCQKLFSDAPYDAVECQKGRLPEGFDGAHHITRLPPFYQASDNPDPKKPSKHARAGIGKSFSWFKLDEVNREGLRQCFVDPEVRIRQMEQVEENQFQRIISMEVGNKGFLRNQRFDFHEGLNSIIGGKGVGKSLAVEFLRFGLDQPPGDDALMKDHKGKVGKRLEPGNYVEIHYQLSDGGVYRLRRELLNVGKESELEYEDSCEEVDTSKPYKGDLSSLFPILAYSQTEIIKIAESKDAQLMLVDRFIDASMPEKEIAKKRNYLEGNDTEFRDAIFAQDQLNSIQKDLDTLEGRIKSINHSLKNPLFESMKAAETEKAELDNRYDYLERLIELIRDFLEEFKSEEPDDLPELLGEDKTLMKVHDLATQAFQTSQDAIGKLLLDMKAQKKAIGDAIAAWMKKFDKLSADYEELLKDIGGDREDKERERKSAEKQKKEYESEAKKHEKKIKKLSKVISNRKKALDDLERAYRTYYEIRKDKFDELSILSDGKLRLELEHAKDRSRYEKNLSDILKGGSNAPSVSDRRKIARNVAPRRLVRLVLDRNVPHLANEADITELWAERAIEKLWSADDFAEVLALQHNCYPADVPSIKFRKDGGQYDELSELSIGQKCTALLIIALCDGTMPIVIDQPEDALDTMSVWEDIAKKLRRGKNSRQFILATHNSTVAVAADSDQFIFLKAGSNTGKVVFSGAIDRENVKKAVIAHLEGGDEPYKLRARKYNIQ